MGWRQIAEAAVWPNARPHVGSARVQACDIALMAQNFTGISDCSSAIPKAWGRVERQLDFKWSCPDKKTNHPLVRRRELLRCVTWFCRSRKERWRSAPLLLSAHRRNCLTEMKCRCNRRLRNLICRCGLRLKLKTEFTDQCHYQPDDEDGSDDNHALFFYRPRRKRDRN
jgi:hypothetical protein